MTVTFTLLVRIYIPFLGLSNDAPLHTHTHTHNLAVQHRKGWLQILKKAKNIKTYFKGQLYHLFWRFGKVVCNFLYVIQTKLNLNREAGMPTATQWRSVASAELVHETHFAQRASDAAFPTLRLKLSLDAVLTGLLKSGCNAASQKQNLARMLSQFSLLRKPTIHFLSLYIRHSQKLQLPPATKGRSGSASVPSEQ